MQRYRNDSGIVVLIVAVFVSASVRSACAASEAMKKREQSPPYSQTLPVQPEIRAAEVKKPAAAAQPKIKKAASQSVAVQPEAKTPVVQSAADPVKEPPKAVTQPAGTPQEAEKSAEPHPQYRIGNGDFIEIGVWGHTELQRSLRVLPDGSVNFPLIGSVKAAGVTPDELSAKVREKLLHYFRNPLVSVLVLDYKSKQILVIGEVVKPGLYQYEGAMTVFDAVGTAGGYKKHAELKSILVVRNGYAKTPKFYLADMYRLIHNGSRIGNLPIQPGDIVYVPQNFIGNVGDFFDFWMSKVRPAADLYYLHELNRHWD